VLNRLAEKPAVLDPILESGKTQISKAGLRKFILQSKGLSLSRLDCHILVKM